MRMFGQHVVKPQTRHTAFELTHCRLPLSLTIEPTSPGRACPRPDPARPLVRATVTVTVFRAVLGGVEAMGLLEEAVDQHQIGQRAQSAQRRPEQHRGDGLRVQKEGIFWAFEDSTC